MTANFKFWDKKKKLPAMTIYGAVLADSIQNEFTFLCLPCSQ